MLGISAGQVLPFSTGVILELLPVERIKAGLPAVFADLKADNWHAAAHGIMTTDTIAKARVAHSHGQREKSDNFGVSKGAGMIRPNMATMLGFLATDAGIAQPLLDKLVKEAADASFNCITVDGDTSTNDSYVMIATGQSGASFAAETDAGWADVKAAIIAVSVQLAQAIVRDGEGATKFITVAVQGGKDVEECRKVGYAIGHSPLVKTAFFASDPNLGRILAAVGYAGINDLDVDGVKVWLDDVLVAEQGGRAAAYREEDGARVMAAGGNYWCASISAAALRGARVYTCDFSYDYVKINADYRS